MSTNQTNGFDKTAKIFATDFAHETFIAFKANKPFDCDNSKRNNIKRIQYILSKLLSSISKVVYM